MIKRVWLVWCSGPMDKEKWLHGVYGSEQVATKVADNLSNGSVTEADIQYTIPQWMQQQEHTTNGYREYSRT